MSFKKEFLDLLESTEIIRQVKNNLDEEPVKLLHEICAKSGQDNLPVPDYNLPIQGYTGDVALKALVQAGLVDKVDGGRVALYSYKPTSLGIDYCKKLKK
jgi:hypothetical protein